MRHYDISRSTAADQVKPDQWGPLVSDTESATEADMWDPVKADVAKSKLTGGPTVVSANLKEQKN